MTKYTTNDFLKHYRDPNAGFIDHSTGVERSKGCEVRIYPKIVSALKRGDIGTWCYGEFFNSNLWNTVLKWKQGNKAIDIGPGDKSAYPSFLSAAGYSPIAVYDIRQPKKVGKGIKPITKLKGRFDFVLCISVLEHAGLGRYGDEIDPAGDIKLAEEIVGTLKPGGVFVFAVPIGIPLLIMNTHRIYNNARLKALMRGCEFVEEIGARMTKPDETKQPIIVARKRT